MPYLHWETDRRRSKVDEIIRNLVEEHKAEEHKEKERERLSRERFKAAAEAKSSNCNVTPIPALPPPVVKKDSLFSIFKQKKDKIPSDIPQAIEPVERNFRPIRSITEVLDEVNTTKTTKKGPQMLNPRTVLGQVLYRAALLFEAMEYYFDQELLRDYLHETPPLHPRRTLDQSYYWTLKTTKKRDRDQVVYRGTAPDKEFMHHHNCGKEKENCKKDQSHCDWTSKEGCDQCQHDIRKVARVVMVDQLWLWILDASTSPRLFVFKSHSF
jgi:hypothetical protein